MEKQEKYYTIKEVAELLQVHKNTVNRWIAQGDLKAVKINQRNVRITETQLDNFLNKGGSENANGK